MPENSNQIVLVSGVRGDTRRYRLFHPWEYLRLAGYEPTLAHISDPDLPTRLQHAGLVLLQRVSWNPWVGRQLAELRRRQARVLADVDDLIFDPAAFRYIDSPDFADPVRAALYQEEMRRNRQTLAASDAILASTGYLAEQAGGLGRPVYVLRNAFSQEMLELSQAARQAPPAERASGKVIIGYASGTLTHNRDFAMIRPALERVMARFPQVELWLAGPLDPGANWGSLAERIRPLALVPWRDLPPVQAQFDINLAPLRIDNPFGQSKSELKFIEAALVGRPTIASPSEAFRTAIRPGENGLLAEGSQQWEQALSLLVENPELRRALGEQAYEDVMEGYHPRQRAADLLRILGEARALPAQPPAAPRPAIQRLQPQDEIHPTIWQVGLYNLRHRGWMTLLMQIWIFFRRLIAPIFPYRRYE